ncbi:MAG: ribonuclease domain-containing protein [Pseudomonadota bacterium]
MRRIILSILLTIAIGSMDFSNVNAAPADAMDIFKRTGGTNTRMLSPDLLRQYDNISGLARNVTWPSGRTSRIRAYQDYKSSGGKRPLHEFDLSARQTIQNGKEFGTKASIGAAQRGYYNRSTGLFTGVDRSRSLITSHNSVSAPFSKVRVSSVDHQTVATFLKRNNFALPDNYITKAEARQIGWRPNQGNLAEVAPGKSIGGDRYYNQPNPKTGSQLPNSEGRVWFEADLNYNGGYRGRDRLLFSNDGLVYRTVGAGKYSQFERLN